MWFYSILFLFIIIFFCEWKTCICHETPSGQVTQCFYEKAKASTENMYDLRAENMHENCQIMGYATRIIIRAVAKSASCIRREVKVAASNCVHVQVHQYMSIYCIL